MSSFPPDPYKVLGVSKDAQTPEIRSAHRKLVLKCHPDKVQDPTLKAKKQASVMLSPNTLKDVASGDQGGGVFSWPW